MMKMVGQLLHAEFL